MNEFLRFNLLILLLCALKKMSEGKISRRLQYAMWITLPVYLLFAAAVELKPASGVAEYISPALSIPIAKIEIAVSRTLSSAAARFVEFLSAHNIAIDDRLFAAVRFLRYAIAALLLLAFLAYNLCFVVHCRRRRRFYKRDGITGMKLYLLDDPRTPFLLGRSIYIHPDMTQNPVSLEHAVCHESCHFRQGDLLWTPLRLLLTIFYWYDPLVWLAGDLIRRDGELACDERALSLLGEEQRQAYGLTLITLLKAGRNGIRFDMAAMMKGTKRLIQSRISAIARKRQRSAAATALVILCMVLNMGCILTGAGISFFSADERTADAVFVWDGTGADRDTIRRVTLYRIRDDMSCPGIDITDEVLSGQAVYLHAPGSYRIHALTDTGMVDLSARSADQRAHEAGLLPLNTFGSHRLGDDREIRISNAD